MQMRRMGKQTDLLEAIRNEDVASVRRMLSGHRGRLSKLIGQGKTFDINFRDSSGLSPLHVSTLTGNIEVTSLLLQHGCNIDIADNKGLRPLHYAAWKGLDSVIDLLCLNGSSVNAPALDGSTPLHLAAEYGTCSAVERLLRRGADPLLTNRRRRRPFDLACEFGRTSVVQLMIIYVPSCLQPGAVGPSETTCLHLAARNGHVDVVRLLLHAGMDVNVQTTHGTCLHEAAMFGRTDVVRLLLSCGVDATRLNAYEQTALDIVNKNTPTCANRDIKMMLREYSRGSNWSVQQRAVQSVTPLPFSQTFHDVRQHRLSGHSSFGSSGSLVQYHQPMPAMSPNYSSSSNSLLTLDRSDQNGHGGFDVQELIRQGLSSTEMIQSWLASLQLDDYCRLFVQAGYDMPTISRMTPEDLTAIGVTSPTVRKKLKAEINRLNVRSGLDTNPKDVGELLRLLGLESYAETLCEQGYRELEAILDITWEDLEEIGIQKLGHQKKMMLAIEQLKRIHANQRRASSLSRTLGRAPCSPSPYPTSKTFSENLTSSNSFFDSSALHSNGTLTLPRQRRRSPVRGRIFLDGVNHGEQDVIPPPAASDVVAIRVGGHRATTPSRDNVDANHTASASLERRGGPGNSDFRSPESDAERTPTNERKSLSAPRGPVPWRPSAKVLPSLKPSTPSTPMTNGEARYLERLERLRMFDDGGTCCETNGLHYSAYGTLPRRPLCRRPIVNRTENVGHPFTDQTLSSFSAVDTSSSEAIWQPRRDPSSPTAHRAETKKERPVPPRRAQSFKTADEPAPQDSLRSSTSMVLPTTNSDVTSPAADCQQSPATDRLPFANENVGTMRQRTGTGQSTGAVVDGRSDVRDEREGGEVDDVVDGQSDVTDDDSTLGGFESEFDDSTIKRCQKVTPVVAEETKDASGSNGSSGGDVTSSKLFSDIDVMLVGLAAELDELLKLQT